MKFFSWLRRKFTSKPPRRLPIQRFEDYETHYIGSKPGGGYFMAFVTSNIDPLNWGLLIGDGWERRKKWFSVVHHFDANGRHTKSDITTHGTSADGEKAVAEKAWQALDAKLKALGKVTLGDIAVERFRVEHDGCVFGLLTNEESGLFDPEEQEPDSRYHIHLLPNDLLFYPPWNGEYDT
jgi:hypothetical protein